MVTCKKAASKLAKCSWKNKPKGPNGKYKPRSKSKLAVYKAKAVRRKVRIKKLKKKLTSTKKVVKKQDATIKALQAPVEAPPRQSSRAKKKPQRYGQ